MKFNKKKQLSILLAVAVGFSTFTFTSVDKNTTFAKEKYTVGTVSKFKTVKSSSKQVYVYRKASTSSEKSFPLGKNMGVMTTGKTQNGFSQIRSSFGYGYVKTSVLKSVKANTSSKKYAWNTSGNYKFKLFKSHANKSFQPLFYKVYNKNLSVRNNWLYSDGNMTVGLNEFDTNKGLYSGLSENGIYNLVVKYPVKKNKSWTSEGQKYKILSTTVTVKTSAGTFKNVVKVKSGSYISYYAPNKGLIKTMSKKGKKYSTDFILMK